MSTPTGGPPAVPGPTLASSMWRYRYGLVVVAVLCGLTAFLVSSRQPETYTAHASLLLTDPSTAGIFGTSSEVDFDRYVQLQADYVTSADVYSLASELLGGGTQTRDLARATSVEPNLELGAISIATDGSDPDKVADQANAVAKAYEQLRKERNLQTVETAGEALQQDIARLQEESQALDERLSANPDDTAAASKLSIVQTQLSALQSRISEIAADTAIFGAGLELVEEAPVPNEPSSPKPVRDALFVAILGLATASAAAYWRAGDIMKREMHEDVREILGARRLGEVPRLKQMEQSDAPGYLFNYETAEIYDFLLSSIELALAELGATSILITSAVSGEGKTSAVLNLGMALARVNRRVTLVDTDIRGRSLTATLSAESDDGLIELAAGKNLADCTRRYRLWDDVELSVVPAGEAREEPTGLLRGQEFKNAIATIKRSSELSIFDSPPVLSVADATVIATQVDAIILIVDAQTSADDLRKVQERFALLPTPIVGYIYNRASTIIAFNYNKSGHGVTPASGVRRSLTKLRSANK